MNNASRLCTVWYSPKNKKSCIDVIIITPFSSWFTVWWKCVISASQTGFCLQLWPSSKSEKWHLLWRLIHYRKSLNWVLGPKCTVSNQSFQQILPKHWKLGWGLNLQRSACCLQLVNMLPLISTTSSSSSFLSCLSLISPLSLLAPSLPQGKSLKWRFLGIFFPKWVLFCCVYGLGFGRASMLSWNLI